MELKKRLAGRFLPSRVYARWKWTVRFGVCAVPLIILLTGGLALYFEPSRYSSTAEFEYLGKRPRAEAEGLIKTRNVLEDSARSCEFAGVLGVDMDSAVGVLSDSLETDLDPVTGILKVTVTHPLKVLARDLAASLPVSLEKYEIQLTSEGIRSRLNAAEESLKELEQSAEDKQQMLGRVIATRGDQATDAIGRLDVDAARSDWEDAHQQVLQERSRITALKRELEDPGNWVRIHSPPQISQTSINDKGNDLLGVVLLQALGLGMGFALIVPYFLELLFPRRRFRKSSQGRDNAGGSSYEFSASEWQTLRIGEGVRHESNG